MHCDQSESSGRRSKEQRRAGPRPLDECKGRMQPAGGVLVERACSVEDRAPRSTQSATIDRIGFGYARLEVTTTKRVEDRVRCTSRPNPSEIKPM